MDTALAVKTIRRQSWQLMIKEQSESGLSIRDWCETNGISTKTFYYRRKQLQSMFLETAQPSTFAELIPPAETDRLSEKPLSPSTTSFMPQLTIAFGDVVMGIDENTPKHLIADAMEMIRNA